MRIVLLLLLSLVILVTSNTPAAMDMSATLTEHGYKSMGGFVFERG
jgi:hypothetical protein